MINNFRAWLVTIYFELLLKSPRFLNRENRKLRRRNLLTCFKAKAIGTTHSTCTDAEPHFHVTPLRESAVILMEIADRVLVLGGAASITIHPRQRIP